jgi:preprotein translocase subunit Sec63
MISSRRQVQLHLAALWLAAKSIRYIMIKLYFRRIIVPKPDSNKLMTLEEARELLRLATKATKKDIKAAFRREARRWHPDGAPAGEEAVYRARMQQVNAAYQRVVQFIEEYRYDLVESAGSEDLQQWWMNRFYTGVWSPPPPKDSDDNDD